MAEAGQAVGATWARQIEEVISGMAAWRTAHPQATFAEIEVAVEEQLTSLRTRMLADAALARAAAGSGGAAGAGTAAAACALCGEPLVARGQQTRAVRVRGGGQVALARSYQTCRQCGRGLFPPG